MKALVAKLKWIVFIGLALTAIGCAKSGGGGGGDSSTPACPANQLYTGAGCLPTCGSGMVWYNNSCVAASSVVAGGGLPGGQSCPAGYILQYGQCVPAGGGGQQCPAGYVLQGNMCVPNTGGGGYPGGDMCSGRCGAGAVETFSGCMPQYTCGPCYGYNNGWCHIGVYAHQYYGY